MDKRVLQTYAVWAKENLEQQIEVSLKTLGIKGDNVFLKAKQSGDYTYMGKVTCYYVFKRESSN